MLNSSLLCLIFLFYFSSAILSQETLDEGNPTILWDPIPNASKYQLEIRNEDKEIILKEEVKETSYGINLEPGQYSHRIGAYNKFNKLASQSDWIPFIIAKSLAPEVTSEKQIIGSKKDSEKTILIKGNYFSKFTKVSLVNKTGKILIHNMLLNNREFELILDHKSARAGNYDLIMENPRKKILTIKNYYILEDKSIFTFPSNYPYWKEASMSALLPGWGQVKKQQIFSAVFLDLALLASAGYYKSTMDTFYSEKNKYDQSVIMGALLLDMKIKTATMYGLYSSEAQFIKADASAKQVHIASVVIISIYCINILDALLWKSSVKTANNEYNSHFYTKLQMAPVINSNSAAAVVSPQIEFGFRVEF